MGLGGSGRVLDGTLAHAACCGSCSPVPALEAEAASKTEGEVGLDVERGQDTEPRPVLELEREAADVVSDAW